jgi:glycosyltransferase involved in cell wall biosynthesis
VPSSSTRPHARAATSSPEGSADASALADAVQGLLDDPARLRVLGESARRRIEQEFPLDRMVDGYEQALREVIGRGG